MSESRLWRIHTIAGALPVLWAMFHLWEQWAAFAGRDAWLARMTRTSHGPSIAAEILFGVAPAVLWIALEVRLRLRGREPDALRLALAEHEPTARRLGLLARTCSGVFFAWLLYHAAWLWLPKLVAGSEPLRAWLALRNELGRWPEATLHAIGLTAFCVHLVSSVTRVTIDLGWASTPESRRAARLSGLIVAVGVLVLLAQLAGWHAAGRGTLWS